MRPLYLTCFIPLFLGVIVLDQLTKWWISASFALYEVREVVPHFFNLVYYTNNGAAFSLLAGQPALWRQTFFIGATLIALVVLVFAYRSYSKINGWFTIALALIAGGAVGNLIDRIHLSHVIDFLDVYYGSYHWPAFNVADSAITVGVSVFMLVSLLSKQSEK